MSASGPLKFTDTVLQEINRRLTELINEGFHKLPPEISAQSLRSRGLMSLVPEHAYGSNCIIIPVTQFKQVLKISLADSHDLSDDAPMYLKPLTGWQENGLKFQLFPEVKILKNDDPEAWKYVHIMGALSLECGYMLWDLKPENLVC